MYAYKIAGRPNLGLRIKGFRAGRGFDEGQWLFQDFKRHLDRRMIAYFMAS